jgi:uncharacterized protein
MSTIDRHIPGTLSWVDLLTPDLEGALKFHGGIFGWTFEVGGPETSRRNVVRRGDAPATALQHRQGAGGAVFGAGSARED